MDITIPPHNVKCFASSIACLGKIGKDLYLSFDPLDGLILSSLNEAKSAYGKFHFEPGFFEKCSGIIVPIAGNRRKRNPTNRNEDTNNTNNNNNEAETTTHTGDARYVCRVPVRSIHSILRPRKGVLSLRIRSEGMDDDGNYLGLNPMKTCDDDDDDDGQSHSRSRNKDEEEINNDDGKGHNRPSRSRKRRRKRRNNHADNEEDRDYDDDNTYEISKNTEKMMLSFEYCIECCSTSKNDTMNRNYHHHHHHHHHPRFNTNDSISQNGKKNHSRPAVGGTIFRVMHKVGVTDCRGISLSESSTHRRTRSEIISPPQLWLRLIDPLRRTPEMALTIDNELKVVTATSFHPTEGQGGNNNSSSSGNNAILQAMAARNAMLKTEASMGADEFDEFDYRNNRGKKQREEDNILADDETYEVEDERDRPPLDVNEKVILVFSIKEAKAMLQFCARTNSHHSYDDEIMGGGVIFFSFHWGGRPIIIETEGDHYTAELVLATLHHGMISSNIAVSGTSG